jgi:hypothetical protein
MTPTPLEKRPESVGSAVLAVRLCPWERSWIARRRAASSGIYRKYSRRAASSSERQRLKNSNQSGTAAVEKTEAMRLAHRSNRGG